MEQTAHFRPTVRHLDLGEVAVTSHLMDEPDVYGLAATLARVEHWVFDRSGLPESQRQGREARLAAASAVVEGVMLRLDAGAELIDFMCSVSSRRRFVMLWFLETVRPSLVQELAEYAFRYRHQQPNCAHYVHWLDIVSKAQLIARIFGDDNVVAVTELLRRFKH